jgi:hypothetical protein
VELGACHTCGAQNFEVAPRFFGGNLYTLALALALACVKAINSMLRLCFLCRLYYCTSNGREMYEDFQSRIFLLATNTCGVT